MVFADENLFGKLPSGILAPRSVRAEHLAADVTRRLVTSVTSATRPGAPVVSQIVYETDTGNLMVWNGSAWVTVYQPGVWTDFTPAWTNLTVGNGTNVGQCARIGRVVFFNLQTTLGSTTSISGDVSFAAPVTPRNPGGGVGRFTAVAQYLQPATREWIGAAHLVDVGTAANRVVLRHTEAGNAGNTNATNPFTWVAQAEIRVSGTYEAAS